MESQTLSFGQRHFGNVELGDERRNRRLPLLVDETIRHPGGSLPEKLPRPADPGQAFYRPLRCGRCDPRGGTGGDQRANLAKVASHTGILLVLHDTTELITALARRSNT